MDVYIEIADAIKKDVSDLLKKAFLFNDERYWYRSGDKTFIRWKVLRDDINQKIDSNLTA